MTSLSLWYWLLEKPFLMVRNDCTNKVPNNNYMYYNFYFNLIVFGYQILGINCVFYSINWKIFLSYIYHQNVNFMYLSFTVVPLFCCSNASFTHSIRVWTWASLYETNKQELAFLHCKNALINYIHVWIIYRNKWVIYLTIIHHYHWHWGE